MAAEKYNLVNNIIVGAMKILNTQSLALAIFLTGAATKQAVASTNSAPAEAARQIQVDYRAVKGTNDHYEAVCVGAGRIGELLRKAAMDQLSDVHANCGFQYLRFHGLFHDEMGVYSETKGTPNYNFQHIDLAYDAILNAGMKPFVELSFMPSALASSNKTVFWWKANVSTPKNYEKWGALVREFTLHLEKRYGREEIKKWYFEVWNEPNNSAFFTGTIADYFKLYEVSTKAVKSVCQDYQVGGPATAGNTWIMELIDYCQSNQVPLDFISTHTYGVKALFDEYGQRANYLIAGDDVISKKVEKSKQIISQSSLPNLPLFYTEWSSSSSPRDPVHDSYLSAAYILNALNRSAGFTDAMSYWTYTDVFEEGGPAPSPFHGGFGLINLQGLRKPSYFAYKFLHEMGGEKLVCSDDSAMVCRDKNGLQILFWNFTNVEQREPDNVFFKRDLPAKPLAPVSVTVSNLPAGKYSLQICGVGYRRNDVYDDFLDLGSPPNPTREQVALLAGKNSGAPLVSESIEVKANGIFVRSIDMRENDVYLVKLRHL
jgi:xylan 1,4-beta-xylosidase